MGEPSSLTVGDFNNDGKLDLASANNLPGTVTVSFASTDQPAGTRYTTPPLTLSFGGNPTSIASGDFNSDGITDLAALYQNGGTDNLAVLFSNGNRTFQVPIRYSVAPAPVHLRAADIDHDGIVDLVALTSNGLAVLRGGLGPWTGGGMDRFSFRPFAAANSSRFVLTDLNSDGSLDAVLTYAFSGDVKVALATATGSTSFSPPITYATGFSSSSKPEAGDFNGDGRADIVVTHPYNDRVQVLLSTSTGGLLPQEAVPTAGSNPFDPSVADYDGDGQVDVAVFNGLGGAIGVHLGNGAGSLSLSTGFTLSLPSSLLTADMNNDGRPDLVLASRADTLVVVRLNDVPTSWFSTQPTSQHICTTANSAEFTVVATTTRPGGVLGYRWERLTDGVWQTLNDGGLTGLGFVIGATTQTMRVTPFSDNTSVVFETFRAVALHSCGAFRSVPVNLSSAIPCGGADIGGVGGAPSPCGDGSLDNNDFVVFIDFFFNSNSIADVGSIGGTRGGDGHFDNNDFVVFIDMFFDGCMR